MIGIYLLTNNITNKSYVGQSIHIEKRIKEHKKEYYTKTKLAKAIQEYGFDNFSWKVLEECDISKLDEREQYWINKLNTFNSGYNMTEGGSKKCFNHSEKRVNTNEEVLSLYNQGYSIKEIKNILGRGSWLCIKHQLLECGISEEDIYRRGNQRRCKNNCAVVNQYDLNGNFIMSYISLAEASRQTNISRPNINNVCLGKRKSAGGYIWEFGEERS